MGPPRTELGTCPNLWHCVSSELVYPQKKCDQTCPVCLKNHECISARLPSAAESGQPSAEEKTPLYPTLRTNPFLKVPDLLCFIDQRLKTLGT